MLGGWAQQGTQRAFSGSLKLPCSEAGRCKSTRKIHRKTRFKRLFKDLSREDNCLTIILEILFQNKGLFKFLVQGSYLAIESRKKVLSGNLGHFFGEVICLTIFSGNSF
jgi:hypothetical protein